MAASTANAFAVYGLIAEKYAKLGGEHGPLGAPISDEAPAPFGGRFSQFQHGFIYWHPKTGAFAVWGAIADKWNEMGRVGFGYPITDELPTVGGRGRFNHFRKIQEPGAPETSIFWTPETHAHEVHGEIRKAWVGQGWERGELGYPTSDEFADNGFRRQNFEHGFILWSAQGGAAINTPARAARCERYANSAVAQSQEYFRLGCGQQNDRWQTSYQNHFNFCMGPNGGIADRETSEREGTLSQCRTHPAHPPSSSSAGACNVSATIHNAQCLNADGTPSSILVSGSLSAVGCGADKNSALAAAKANFASQAAIAESPTPGACTYTSQVEQGCLCH